MKMRPSLNVVIVFAIFVIGSGCSRPVDIVSGLSEPDANEIIVVLNSKDIKADKLAVVSGTSTTFTVSAKGSDKQEALKILVENKLPREKSVGLSDVFGKAPGLIPTSGEEKGRYLMALQGEVENMLKILPGIVVAKVNIVIPDSKVLSGLDPITPKGSASVAIVYNPVRKDGSSSVSPEDVKYLVSSAVPDLSPTMVTVVMASNAPMHLVGTQFGPEDTSPASNPPVSSTQVSHTGAMPSKGGCEAGPLGEPVCVPGVTATETTPPVKPEPDKFLLWFFGIVAGLGFALGLFGLRRSISLRKKLLALEGQEGKEQGMLSGEEAGGEGAEAKSV